MSVHWRTWFSLSAVSTLLFLPALATAQPADDLVKQTQNAVGPLLAELSDIDLWR